MQQANALANLVLLLWLPAVVYIFSRYPAQRAVILSILGAWLFLPIANLQFPGIPDYDKMSAASYGVLLSTAIFDVGRFRLFKFSWIDVPMVVWCICPFFSSMSNALGPYDGFSATLAQTVTWGIPYFLGRIYLNTLPALSNLAIGILIGGLLYMPFCLFESRMMVSVHEMLYGFNPSGFAMSIRLGGYRPSVFMNHGLMVGMWMMTAALMGVVLWRTGIVKKVWNIPIAALVVLLLITFFLVRSTGAYVLFAAAILILWVGQQFRNTLAIWLITGGIIFYLYLGATGNFPRQEIVGTLSQVFPADRMQSLDFRFMNEELLSEKARRQITFGWGGYGRNRVYDAEGTDISITDSLWIIAFGIYGLVGLVSIFTALLLPAVAFCIRFPAQLWSHPMVATAAALMISTVMYAYDCVLNAMTNPIFVLTSGGIAGLVVSQQASRKAKTPVRLPSGNRASA